MRLLRLLVAGLCGALLAPALALGQAPVPSSHSVRAEALGPATAPPSSAASHLRLHPPLPLDAGRLRAAKAAAAQRLAASRFGALSPTLGGPRSASVFSGLDQPGLSAADNRGDNQGAPSDSTGAIGPSHYVEVVNSKISVYRRTNLSPINALDFDTFVGARGENVFDPQVLWDGSAGRWFYLSDDIRMNGDGRDFLTFGWSKTADPTDLSGGWCRFRVDVDATFGGGAGSFFADYPKLGHDDSRLLFGTNLFNGSSDTGSAFLTANIWTVPKPANGDTSCSAAPTATPTGDPAHPLRTASGVRTFTPVPANVTDRSATGYVVAADSPMATPSPNHLSVYPVSAAGSVGAPRNFAVAPFTTPGSAPQPGTVNTLDTLDSRLTQAVAHADPDAGGDKTIWTQHTIDGPGGRSVVRWYELLPDTSVVRQQGTVQDASTFAFNGAMSPAGDGNHAALFYNLSGSSQLPTLRAQSRSGPQPRGFLGPAVGLGTSNASLNDQSCSPTAGALTPVCRWGDYAAATTDPANSLLVWGSSQLSGPALNPLAGGFQWVTRNFAVNTRDAAPRASFTSSPSRPRTRDRVRFDARGSSDPDGRVVRYRWNFGGRAGSTSATPSHVYGRVGRYRVTLTVTDDARVSTTVSRVITIADRPPSASLRVLTRHPRARRTVSFSGRRSRDPDGRVIAYRWSFGDRSSSRRSAPTHVFRRPGRYRVSLTVIDNSHRRTTTRRILTVGR